MPSETDHLDTVKYLLECGADVNHFTSLQETPLTFASKTGHVDTVKYLVEYGTDVNHFTQ